MGHGCSVQIVSADHSSGCMVDEHLTVGGEAAGLILIIPIMKLAIYHAGDTNVFKDMEIINYLYKPTYLLLPIGGHFTMGPREAALATARYLIYASTVIPMHFGTFTLLNGTVAEF